MAQLSENPFALEARLLTIDEALAALAARVRPIADAEEVAIAEADGRVLTAELRAPIDLPRFDNSAVDGYAVAFADLDPAVETLVRVSARIAAGEPAPPALARGTAARIFTGAPMPPGADTVFMQEDARVLDDGRVALPAGLEPGDNCRLRAEDIAAGTTALAAGKRLRPQDVALAAALGCARLEVRRQLRIAVFSTGDEIVSPGEPLGPAAIYDANRFALGALLRRQGAHVTDLGIVPDDRPTLCSRLAAAARTHDLVITSGGVSTGDEDHVRAAVESCGALVFWRLAVKPGRPVAMGVVGETPFVGLPGNPVAVFVTFAYVVRPLLAALAGETWQRPVPLRAHAAFAHRKKAGRREYLRVTLAPGDGGIPNARIHPVDGAGIITSLTRTDGLVEVPETATAIVPGDAVDFLAYDTLF